MDNTGINIDEIINEFLKENGIASESIEETSSDIIRPNSPTLLVDESSSRFSGAVWAEAIRKKTIILAGLGGIGSYVGFLLSRVKPHKIVLYDPDLVDSSNMSGQLYSKKHIGCSKVTGLTDIINSFSNYYSISSSQEPYSHNSSFVSDIMICGFDNMAARKDFYNAWKSHVNLMKDKKNALFIDGRLAAEEFQVFCIKGDDKYHMKQYENNWLFSDEEADETVCSYKQTSHCANMIASVMVNLFVNFVANQCEPIIDRDVPFLTSYDASTMYFKTIS